jgi:hypothetical protein
MMANERLIIFENSGEIDLSTFSPKSETAKPKPARARVKAVTEAAQFPSREGTAPAAEPLKHRPRYHKTGRTAQLNVRIMPAAHARVYEITDQQGWLVGETIEHALEALERELKEGKHES